MSPSARLENLPVNQLTNYDLTRKVYAIRNLEILTRLTEREAAKAEPNLAAVAGLGTAIAAMLAAVG
jgi:hypothetical protein